MNWKKKVGFGVVLTIVVFQWESLLQFVEISGTFSKEMITTTANAITANSIIGKSSNESVSNSSEGNIDKEDIIIIFPYRDRKVHYTKHMAHLKQIERKNWNFIVYVIEQGDELPFRRAWLFNIGIHEVSLRFKQQQQQQQHDNKTTCIITHDVDLFANETVDYNWCDRPTQMCSELSCFGGGVPFFQSAGGVISASLEHWNAVNGMTNTGFGWGGEDDDLFY